MVFVWKLIDKLRVDYLQPYDITVHVLFVTNHSIITFLKVHAPTLQSGHTPLASAHVMCVNRSLYCIPSDTLTPLTPLTVRLYKGIGDLLMKMRLPIYSATVSFGSISL